MISKNPKSPIPVSSPDTHLKPGTGQPDIRLRAGVTTEDIADAESALNTSEALP